MEDEGASYGAALKGEAMHPTSTSRSDLLLLCLPSLHRHGSNSLKMTLNNFNSHFYALLFYFIFVFSSHNNSCYTQHVLYGMSCIVSPSFSFSQTFFHSMYHPPLACFGLPSLTLPYLTLPCLALPCLTLPYLAMPCLAMPSLTLPSITLPCYHYYYHRGPSPWVRWSWSNSWCWGSRCPGQDLYPRKAGIRVSQSLSFFLSQVYYCFELRLGLGLRRGRILRTSSVVTASVIFYSSSLN